MRPHPVGQGPAVASPQPAVINTTQTSLSHKTVPTVRTCPYYLLPQHQHIKDHAKIIPYGVCREHFTLKPRTLGMGGVHENTNFGQITDLAL